MLKQLFIRLNAILHLVYIKEPTDQSNVRAYSNLLALKSYPKESMFNAFRKLNTKSLLASGYLRIFLETSHNSPICNECKTLSA